MDGPLTLPLVSFLPSLSGQPLADAFGQAPCAAPYPALPPTCSPLTASFPHLPPLPAQLLELDTPLEQAAKYSALDKWAAQLQSLHNLLVAKLAV